MDALQAEITRTLLVRWAGTMPEEPKLPLEDNEDCLEIIEVYSDGTMTQLYLKVLQ